MSNLKHAVRLNELLIAINEPPLAQDCLLTHISLDSRSVTPGTLFVAYPGQQVDGRHYIAAAIQSGAVAIMAEAEQFAAPHAAIPVILVKNLTQKISLLAAQFYQQPSKQLAIYGVTGTNGKTSCTQFIAAALSQLDKPCAVMGTLGYGFPQQLIQHTVTTPDAIRTQQLLLELQTQGAQAVAMEVSSHALVQGRVNAVDFDIAILTNITRDHLDYHGDMQHYANAKRRLFDAPHLRYAIINIDDPMGRQFATELATKLTVFGYSLQSSPAAIKQVTMIYAQHVAFNDQGIAAEIITPWGRGWLQTQLLGKFNLSNLLAVITVLGLNKIPLADSLHQLSTFRGVSGRVETYGGGEKPLVVVDYAHTPDALEQVLSALRPHCRGQLWCIFGCGGERDRGKRSLMGSIAQQHAEHIILTDDNPRHEQPQQIIADIMQGITATASVVVEHDRRRAINHALACAKAGDIVLIAGKGHEDYQQIGDQRLPFSDALEVKRLLK